MLFLFLFCSSVQSIPYLTFDERYTTLLQIRLNLSYSCQGLFADDLIPLNMYSIQISNLLQKDYTVLEMRLTNNSTLSTSVYLNQSFVRELIKIQISSLDGHNSMVNYQMYIGPYFYLPQTLGYLTLRRIVKDLFNTSGILGMCVAILRYFRPLGNVLFSWYPLLIVCSRAMIPPNIYICIMAFSLPLIRWVPRDQALNEQTSESQWTLFPPFMTPPRSTITAPLQPLSFLSEFYFNLDLSILCFVLFTLFVFLRYTYKTFTCKPHQHNTLFIILNYISFFQMEVQMAVLCHIQVILVTGDYNTQNLITLVAAIMIYLFCLGLIVHPIYLSRMFKNQPIENTDASYEQWEQIVRIQLDKDKEPMADDEFMKIIPKFKHVSMVYNLDLPTRIQMLQNYNVADKHAMIFKIPSYFKMIDLVVVTSLFWGDSTIILSLMMIAQIIKIFVVYKYLPDGEDTTIQKIINTTQILRQAALLVLVFLSLLSDQLVSFWVGQNFYGFYLYGLIMIFALAFYLVTSMVYLGAMARNILTNLPQVEGQLNYVRLTMRAIQVSQQPQPQETTPKQIEMQDYLAQLDESVDRQSLKQHKIFQDDIDDSDNQTHENKVDDIEVPNQFIQTPQSPFIEDFSVNQDIPKQTYKTYDEDENENDDQDENDDDDDEDNNNDNEDNENDNDDNNIDIDNFEVIDDDEQLANIIGEEIALKLIIRALDQNKDHDQEQILEQETRPLYPMDLIKQNELQQYTELFRNGCFNLMDMVVSFQYSRQVLTNNIVQEDLKSLKQFHAQQLFNLEVRGKNVINIHNISQVQDILITRLYIKCYQDSNLIFREKRITNTIVKANDTLSIEQVVPFELCQGNKTLEVKAEYKTRSLDEEEQEEAKTRELYVKQQSKYKNLTIDTSEQSGTFSFMLCQSSLKLIKCVPFSTKNYHRLKNRNPVDFLIPFENRLDSYSEQNLRVLERQYNPLVEQADPNTRYMFMKFNTIQPQGPVSRFYIVFEIQIQLLITIFLKKQKYSKSVLDLIREFGTKLQDYLS